MSKSHGVSCKYTGCRIVGPPAGFIGKGSEHRFPLEMMAATTCKNNDTVRLDLISTGSTKLKHVHFSVVDDIYSNGCGNLAVTSVESYAIHYHSKPQSPS